MATSKRLTPANDPELLVIWEEKVASYQTAEGAGKWEACERVGEEYAVSAHTVYDWVTPRRREQHRQYLLERGKERRQMLALSGQLRRDLRAVFGAIFEGAEELTAPELVRRASHVVRREYLAESVQRLYSLLPIEATREGAYRWRSEWER